METSTDITANLVAWSDGDDSALADVYPLVHRELRKIAKNHLYNFRPGNIFQTTALINDAYIRLLEQKSVKWKSRSHFYAIASKMMRRILLNHIRDAKRQKRGGGARQVTLNSRSALTDLRIEEIIDVDAALSKFELIEPRMADVVVCKYYGGMKIHEIAEALEISPVTVNRSWRFAKAWLARELKG